MSIENLLSTFSQVAANPKAEMQKHLAAGKKVIGVGPYYIPEELVYAAGAVPFGVWGCVGSATEAKKYFPPFYCSICQMTLEMGLTGKLDGLSGLMVTGLCDTLRAFSQNWRSACGDRIPMIYVSNSMNRFGEAGYQYTLDSYREVARGVEECAHAIITDEALVEANKLYNQWRVAMREFVALAGSHPAEVSVSNRVAVINAGYFMDKAEHLALVEQLNQELRQLPDSGAGYRRVVLSGIYEDIPALADILDENKYAVVADDLAKESRSFARVVAEEGDPLEALAKAWCAMGEDSILYDPKKSHIEKVVKLAQDSKADGVIMLLAKFCDPEEFDTPLVAKALRKAGIPVVTVEIDQSTESYEQVRTQLETFAEIIG